MKLPTQNQDPAKGEQRTHNWTYQFFDLTPIEAGAKIVPAKLESRAALEFSALQLIVADLSYAMECFKEADKLGLPDAANLHSKALIFSGVVSYSRPFKTSVREIKLDSAFFSDACQEFDLDLHNYLIAVRDKHIAHSVNEFEQCEATGVMVSSEQRGWRAAGIGFTQTIAIGLSRFIVEHAIAQISGMLTALTSDIDRRRLELYADFVRKYTEDGKWEMAPIARFPQRENIAKRRP